MHFYYAKYTQWNGDYAVAHIVKVGVGLTKERWGKEWLTIVGKCIEMLKYIAIKCFWGDPATSWEALHGLGEIGKNSIEVDKSNILRASLKRLAFLNERANSTDIKIEVATELYHMGGLTMFHKPSLADIVKQALNKVRKNTDPKILQQSAEQAKTRKGIEADDIEKFKEYKKGE